MTMVAEHSIVITYRLEAASWRELQEARGRLEDRARLTMPERRNGTTKILRRSVETRTRGL